jgi:hypothetical protein
MGNMQVLLPEVQVCQHRFVHSFDISLHLSIDLLTPLWEICLGKVPVTISLLEEFIYAVEGCLGGKAGSPAYCDNVVVDTFSLEGVSVARFTQSKTWTYLFLQI